MFLLAVEQLKSLLYRVTQLSSVVLDKIIARMLVYPYT